MEHRPMDQWMESMICFFPRQVVNKGAKNGSMDTGVGSSESRQQGFKTLHTGPFHFLHWLYRKKEIFFPKGRNIKKNCDA